MAKIEVCANPTVVLVGDAHVGKSTLFCKYVNGHWPDTHTATIASVYARKALIVNDEKVVLSIFDTPGAIRMRDLLVHYFRQAAVIMLCFENDDEISLKDHVGFIRDHTDVPILLVMTKVDDCDVTRGALVKKYAEVEQLPFILTSSVSDLNVSNAFQQAAALGADYLRTRGYTINGSVATIELPPPRKAETKKGFDLSSWC